MEIVVTWKRTLNVKPYETESLELGIRETIDAPRLLATPDAATKWAMRVVEIEAAIFRQLAAMGDQLVIERLQTYKK